MLIQKLNAFNIQRYQGIGAYNKSPQQNYMSSIRSNSMKDTVSFGLNLEPKIISPELNNLFGKAIIKLDSEKENLLEFLNKPLNELRSKVDLSCDLNAKPLVLDDIRNFAVNRFIGDKKIIFSKPFSSTINDDYLKINVLEGKDKYAIITIQDNCVTKVAKNGKSLENNAYISSDVDKQQLTDLPFNTQKHTISNPGESSKLNELEKEVKVYLEAILGE